MSASRHTNAPGLTQVVTGVTTPPDTSCHASQHLSCNYGEPFSQSKTCDGTNEFAVTATPLQHRDRDVYEAVKWGEENPDFKSGIRPILYEYS